MTTKGKLLVFCFFLVASIPLHAQKSSIKIPLKDILTNLEKSFMVSFTYADKTIKNISINPPSDTLDLDESINYLRKETLLDFQILNKRFITISEPGTDRITVCGTLKDSEDKVVIEGAIIRSEVGFVISDKNGFFELNDVSNKSVIVIRMLGFKPTTILAKELTKTDIDCGTILLYPVAKELKEITIYNILTSGLHKNLDGSFVIDVDDFGILPGHTEPDVLQTIQSLPGIKSINETISHINVRGGTNDQNLILWNGIRMFQTGHFFGLISAFNPFLYNNITITKNGTTAALGNSVSSTIDIKSDYNLPKKISGGIGMNMINADLFLKIPVSKKLALQLAGRRSFNDIIKTPVYNNYFERAFIDSEIVQISNTDSASVVKSDENFWFYDFSGSLMYDITKYDKVRIHFLNISNTLSYKENTFGSVDNESKTSRLNQESIASGIEYQRLWNNNLSSITKITLSNYVLDAINWDITNNQRLIQQNEVLDNSFELDLLWTVKPYLDLSGGYHFREIGISNLEDLNNPDFFRFIKRVLRSHSLYSEANYKSINGKSNMRFGFRANYYPKYQSLFLEPRINASYEITNILTLSIAGELKNQSVAQIIDYQSDFLGVEKRKWILANNNDFPILNSKQGSLGLILDNESLLISMEGYLKNVSGISSSSQGFQNQFQFIKGTGSYFISGIELLVNKKYKNISSWFSYTISNNDYTFDTFDPSQFESNLDITHIINSGLNYTYKSLFTSVGMNWHSGKPFTLANGLSENQINFAEPNKDRLPNYFRLDLSIKYQFNLSPQVKAQIGGSLLNLTNHENIYNLYYKRKNNVLVEVSQLALGFTPNMMLRIDF